MWTSLRPHYALPATLPPFISISSAISSFYVCFLECERSQGSLREPPTPQKVDEMIDEENALGGRWKWQEQCHTQRVERSPDRAGGSLQSSHWLCLSVSRAEGDNDAAFQGEDFLFECSFLFYIKPDAVRSKRVKENNSSTKRRKSSQEPADPPPPVHPTLPNPLNFFPISSPGLLSTLPSADGQVTCCFLLLPADLLLSAALRTAYQPDAVLSLRDPFVESF